MAMTVVGIREIISNFLLVFFIWIWVDSSEQEDSLGEGKPKQ
jgi:hypothetical protein